MLKDKTIRVFDVDSKKRGDVVRFCFTKWGDEDEREDGKYLNGLIRGITETTMTVTTVDTLYDGVHSITIEQVLADEVRIAE